MPSEQHSRKAELIPLFVVLALLGLVGGSRLMTAKEITTMHTTSAQTPRTTSVSTDTQRYADRIQVVRSSKGVEAWLIEEHSVPLIAVQFAFVGGSTQDPNGKEGVADFLSAMLDEGAGEIKSKQFQAELDEKAIKLDFDTSLDAFSGSFQTLSRNRERAVELLRLAVNQPRFDADAIERIRGQLVSAVKFEEKDPDRIAARTWFATAFDNHAYGRSEKGSASSLQAITKADLAAYRKNVFARDGLKISVVGDIDAVQLKNLLDQVFGELPEQGKLKLVPEVPVLGAATRKVVSMDNPQSVAQFGSLGLKRDDPEFIPAYVLNYILGGGGFSSRLMEQVREKRGLAYSVYSYLYPLNHGAVFLGGVATKNDAVEQSIDVIKAELKRLAEDGPTLEELDNAKRYLTGSYPLRFDTSNKIASQLLWIQMDDLGLDYIDKRNQMVEDVTIDKIRDVAKRLLKPEELIITIVGKPGDRKS